MTTLSLILFAYTIFFTVTCGSYCDDIRKKYAPTERYVTQHGEPKNISLYWDSDPGRAAAAVLKVILHHALGYKNVHLQKTPFTHAAFSSDAKKQCRNGIFQEIQLFSTVKMKSSIERTSEFFLSTPPSKQNLYVHIIKGLRDKEMCKGADTNRGNFFKNISILTDCGFESLPTRFGHLVYVYYLEGSTTEVYKNITFILETSKLHFKFKALSRVKLFKMLRIQSHSFLFIDYNMWDNDKEVVAVELDPYRYNKKSRKPRGNYFTVATSMSSECEEIEYAPEIHEISHRFSPSLSSLKTILEIESPNENIEERSCAWIVYQNYSTVDDLSKYYKPYIKHYKILTFTCDGYDLDPAVMLTFGSVISKYHLPIVLTDFSGDCNDPQYAREIISFMSNKITPSHIGVVIGGIKNTTEYDVIEMLDGSPLPVFLYDAIDVDVDLTKSVWLTNGRMIHLVLALQYFIANNDINHVIVLSEHSEAALLFNTQLREISGFSLYGHNEPNDLKKHDAEHILQNIETNNSSIIILNTNYERAEIILSAAMSLKMNTDRITWILREWKQPGIKLDITYVTFSFWPKFENGVSRTDKYFEIKHFMETNWPNLTFPPHTMAYMDAVLTLVKGFNDVVLKYPEARDDTQSRQLTEQLGRSLEDISPVQVIFRNLTYKGHSPEEAVVHVDIWKPSERQPLARYRVNAIDRSVHLEWKSESNIKNSGCNVSIRNCSILMTMELLFCLDWVTKCCVKVVKFLHIPKR